MRHAVHGTDLIVRSGPNTALWAIAAIAAFAAGVGTAWVNTGAATNSEGRGPGPWRTSAAIGDANASMFTRATVARTGLWALPRSEVIYYLAERDGDGRPLDANCTYELKGKSDLPARWWSVAAYIGYHFADNPTDRYSFTRTDIARDADGGYTIRVSRRPQPGNWLPLGKAPGGLALLTRLYNPDPRLTADPVAVPLATVRRVGCG